MKRKQMELIDDLHIEEIDRVNEGFRKISPEMGNWDPHLFATTNFEVALINREKREKSVAARREFFKANCKEN
jgi:hypothetical protein